MPGIGKMAPGRCMGKGTEKCKMVNVKCEKFRFFFVFLARKSIKLSITKLYHDGIFAPKILCSQALLCRGVSNWEKRQG